MIKTPLALVPYLACGFCVAAGLLWNAEQNLPRPGTVISTGEAAIGGPFTLTDQNGAVRSDADFRGRYTLVYFGYTNCPDVCPTTLVVMAEALKRLGPAGDGIVPIFISVDPARDTPAVLKNYLASFGPQFVGLTGSAQAIAKVAKAYRVYYRRQPEKAGYSVDHSNYIFLMGPDGRFVSVFDETLGPDGLAKALKKQL